MGLGLAVIDGAFRDAPSLGKFGGSHVFLIEGSLFFRSGWDFWWFVHGFFNSLGLNKNSWAAFEPGWGAGLCDYVGPLICPRKLDGRHRES